VKLAALTAIVVLAAIAIIMRRWRSPVEPADWWTCLAAVAVAGLFAGYFLIVLRGAGPTERTGDLEVYLRAAWAAKQGESLYAVTDSGGWHYIYPPLLASLLVPFAEPPPDAPVAAAAVPHWMSACLWYWFCVACLLAAVHLLASALERSKAEKPAPLFSQGWWNLRLLPLLIVLFFVFGDLRRAQPTAIILLCLAGSAAAILRRRSGTAGAWLGVAAALKLFPAYLLLFPLWRRDGRFLAAALATALAASLLPAAIMGPSAALSAYREFVSERLLGEASGGGDSAVAQELHATNTSIQSFEFLLYDALHPDPQARAPQLPPGYFPAHVAISLALTAAALWVMRRRCAPFGDYLFFSALALLSIPILPVSRPHYFLLGLPAVAGMTMAQSGAAGRSWYRRADVIVMAAFLAASILDEARISWALDFGGATLAALLLAALALARAQASPDGNL
jgi:alpha-1,2-mannosyltransferase